MFLQSWILNSILIETCLSATNIVLLPSFILFKRAKNVTLLDNPFASLWMRKLVKLPNKNVVAHYRMTMSAKKRTLLGLSSFGWISMKQNTKNTWVYQTSCLSTEDLLQVKRNIQYFESSVGENLQTDFYRNVVWTRVDWIKIMGVPFIQCE